MRKGEYEHEYQPVRVDIIGPKIETLGFRTDKDKFSSTIRAFKTEDTISTFNAPIEVVSEKDGISEYYDFLNEVISAANADDTDFGTRQKEAAELFASEAVFLTHEDLLEAVSGFAAKYAAELDQDDDLELLFFCKKDLEHKSQGYIRRLITDQLQTLTKDRAHAANEYTINQLLSAGSTRKTKIILCDDWSVTGNGIANDLAALARSKTVDDQPVDVEVSLICAREDQVEHGIASLDQTASLYGCEVSVTSYYQSPAVESVMQGPNPTGSWSSVDYGFSEQLSGMNSYLKSKGVFRDMPAIATIVPQYK